MLSHFELFSERKGKIIYLLHYSNYYLSNKNQIISILCINMVQSTMHLQKQICSENEPEHPVRKNGFPKWKWNSQKSKKESLNSK